MRGWLLLLMLTGVFLYPTVAAAEAKHPGAEGTSVTLTDEEVKLIEKKLGEDEASRHLRQKLEGKGTAEETHPKRSLFEKALDLGIWSLVVFLLLILILSKTAWKWMLEGLSRREADIALAVEESKKARDEAVRLHKELEEVRQKGFAEVRQLLDKARADANSLAAERKAESDRAIQEDRERLRREIATEMRQMEKRILTEAAELATLVSAKTIRRHLTVEDHRGLVDEALAELSQAGESRRHFLQEGGGTQSA
jgi:F-type H+-transporting ATPase subunit b